MMYIDQSCIDAQIKMSIKQTPAIIFVDFIGVVRHVAIKTVNQ
jgi:hypothetical protein